MIKILLFSGHGAKWTLMVIPVMMFTIMANAQVSMLPIAGTGEKMNLNDLTGMAVINSLDRAVDCKLQIIILNKRGEKIMESVTREFSLNKGNNQLNRLPIEKTSYYHSGYRSVIQKSNGDLPPGNYRINYILKTTGGQTISQESTETEVLLINPPHLVIPYDREELEILYPLFTWLPPGPVSAVSELNYRIRVVEIYDNQNAMTAIQLNPAYFEQSGIPSTSLNYQPSARKLNKDKKYAWQIEAFLGNIYIGESEVWEFSFKEDVITNPVESEVIQSFAILNKERPEGFYLAYKKLKFKFEEDYTPGILSVTIKNGSGEEIAFEEELFQKVGENYYIIELKKVSRLKNGEFYTLEVISNKKENYFLKFKYLK